MLAVSTASGGVLAQAVHRAEEGALRFQVCHVPRRHWDRRFLGDCRDQVATLWLSGLGLWQSGYCLLVIV